MKVKVMVEVLPMDWKCVRCRQHKPECKDNYDLCFRCQDFMFSQMNHVCVGCGSSEAEDNLCVKCRNDRESAYDKVLKNKLSDGEKT